MDTWAIFRKARTTLLSLLVLTCLIWTILFAIFLSHEWSYFSPPQKIAVVGLLSLYGFNTIFLYLMIIVHFRLWWDVARVLVLLIIHTGSSMLFTVYGRDFPCHVFGTETACRGFVHTISIGCWVLSGIILCFAIALGVMAFIPRPVKSLHGTEEVDAPLSPASFKAGSPMDEVPSFYAIDSTGRVTYNNNDKLSEEPLSPHRTPSPVNGGYKETITVGLPRPWHGFEDPNLRRSNNTYGGTISRRNAPTAHASVVPVPQRVDSFNQYPLGNSSLPPVSISSPTSMIRPGMGRQNSSIAKSASPRLKHDALSPTPIPLHDSPTPVITPRDNTAEYTPTLYSFPDHNPVQSPPGSHSQQRQTYKDRARMSMSSVYTFQSAAASVYSAWVEPTPHIPPPPVPTPKIARFREPNSFIGPEYVPSRNYASSATSRSNAPLTPKLYEPDRTTQRYGGPSAHQSFHPPIKEGPFSQKGGDGQMLDQTQWQRLVLSAAAKP